CVHQALRKFEVTDYLISLTSLILPPEVPNLPSPACTIRESLCSYLLRQFLVAYPSIMPFASRGMARWHIPAATTLHGIAPSPRCWPPLPCPSNPHSPVMVPMSRPNSRR